jgi:activator of HSP90 ATPase
MGHKVVKMKNCPVVSKEHVKMNVQQYFQLTILVYSSSKYGLIFK